MTDNDVIRLARRYDALMWKQRELISTIRESAHPNADAIADALEEQCEVLAWPTHVISDHLEHPEHFECGDFGIRRKSHKQKDTRQVATKENL
jgi:hypothetical protein